MELPMRQSLLLGAYLAHREDWVSRDELLTVFWPDEDEATARHNLSQLVYHCKRQPWFEGLEAERSRLRWPVPSDLQRFRAALGTGAWLEVVRLYTGPLLDGLPTGLSAGFEEWLEREREVLSAAWHDAVLEVAASCEREGRWSDAIAHLRTVMTQDDLAEDVVQAYLRCAGPAGQRDTALRAFERFRATLRDQLGMEPLETTQRLAETLRRGDGVGQPAVERPAATRPNPARGGASASSRWPAAPTGLPSPATPFIGREAELVLLSAELSGSGARLVTLVGPGGSGKSRLAIEAARRQAPAFDDGALFVPVAEESDPSLLPQALLRALALKPPAGADPTAFLAGWLAPRSMLLVFDNLEHLLPGAGLIPELLAASARSAALITSREPLDVPGESVFEVAGLAYPQEPGGPSSSRPDSEKPGPDARSSGAAAGGQQTEAYEAVTLFVHSARRANPRFAVTHESLTDVARICRLLEGMPLAIELAAAWMRQLRPVEVAADIEASLDLLATTRADVPARQRSVRATLDHSWALLSDEERSALAAIAVFRGGFEKDAAEAVAAVNLRTSLALVNKSLVFRSSDGRFQQLALTRQYGRERLTADPQRYTDVASAHAAYFATLASSSDAAPKDEGQARWLARLADEHENLRAALDWMSVAGEEQAALSMANSLLHYWWLRGHYQEARAVLSGLLRMSNDVTATRAKALSNAGSFARLCEDFKSARELMLESLSIQRRVGEPADVAATIGNLANLTRLLGEYAEAERLMKECLDLFKQSGDRHGEANTLNNLGVLATYRGDAAAAETWYQEALELATASEDELVAGLALGNLAELASDRGDLQTAHDTLGQARAIFERLGYQVGIAANDQRLGELAVLVDDLVSARERFLLAARRFVDLDDHRGIAEVLGSVAALEARLDRPERVLLCAGAAQATFDRLGIVTTDAARDDLRRLVSQAGERVGPAEADRYLDQASGLSVDEVLGLIA